MKDSNQNSICALHTSAIQACNNLVKHFDQKHYGGLANITVDLQNITVDLQTLR